MEHTYNRWFLTCFREHGIPSNLMKKTSWIILVLVSLLLKTSCSGLSSSQDELFSSTQRTPVARFDCGRTAKPLFHEVETVGLWVWFPSMICLGWWAGTTAPPRTPTNQGCELLSVMPFLIAICFIQCFLYVDIWTFTWICYRIQL